MIETSKSSGSKQEQSRWTIVGIARDANGLKCAGQKRALLQFTGNVCLFVRSIHVTEGTALVPGVSPSIVGLSAAVNPVHTTPFSPSTD